MTTLTLVKICTACRQAAPHLTRRRLHNMCDACYLAETSSECACCGGDAVMSGCAIHRDGFGEGPEVPLCETCGSEETPTCEEIWQRIAERRKP
jgi:hypothetical protein